MVHIQVKQFISMCVSIRASSKKEDIVVYSIHDAISMYFRYKILQELIRSYAFRWPESRTKDSNEIRQDPNWKLLESRRNLSDCLGYPVGSDIRILRPGLMFDRFFM